jgi:hypothetical protein
MAESNAFSISGPASRQLYQDLLTALKPLGPFREEVKKTSVHLVRNAAFVGVHPRRNHLRLTVKAGEPIWNQRISRNRWHLEMKLLSVQEIDAELLTWVRQAYELCGWPLGRIQHTEQTSVGGLQDSERPSVRGSRCPQIAIARTEITSSEIIPESDPYRASPGEHSTQKRLSS